MEKGSFPVVHITSVPQVSKMVGVNRILRGSSIINVLGDKTLTEEKEEALRRRYVIRALEILQAECSGPTVFTLEGTLE